MHASITLKRFHIPVEDLNMVYTSYIRPMLEHCCRVWHSSLTEQQKAVIEVLQKRVLMIILVTSYEFYNHALSTSQLNIQQGRHEQLCKNLASSLHHHFQPGYLKNNHSADNCGIVIDSVKLNAELNATKNVQCLNTV